MGFLSCRAAPEVRIAVTEVRAGDTIVVQCERRVPRDVFEKLNRQIQARFAEQDVKVIVLEAGLDLKAVLHKEASS